MQDDSRRRPQLTGAVPEHGSQSGYLGETPGCAEAHGGETESSSSNSVVTSVFNLLNSHSKNTISIWDVAEGQKFILRYANLQFLKLVGKTRQDVFGKTLEEIVRSGGRQISRSFLACARNRREIDFIHKQRNRFLLTRLSPQVELERTVRLIGTSMDITEYIGEQRRLKTANRQIRQQSGLLNMQLRFESMIARTLREFMDAGCAGFEGCLYGINREMGLLLNADQALIFEKRSENLYVHKAYWARNDARFCTAGSHIRSIQEGQSVLPRINRLLVINDTGAGILPAFAGELRHMIIRALLAVPICRDTHTYGLFCLTHTRARISGSHREISMAKTRRIPS
jgi:hypothetical protein